MSRGCALDRDPLHQERESPGITAGVLPRASKSRRARSRSWCRSSPLQMGCDAGGEARHSAHRRDDWRVKNSPNSWKSSMAHGVSEPDVVWDSPPFPPAQRRLTIAAPSAEDFPSLGGSLAQPRPQIKPSKVGAEQQSQGSSIRMGRESQSGTGRKRRSGRLWKSSKPCFHP